MNYLKAIPDINWLSVLRFSLLITILVMLSGASLLALGFANPPHAPHYAYRIGTPAGTDFWIPSDIFTIDLYGTLLADENSTNEWGLWIEDDTGQWLIVGLNGAGYITVRQCPRLFLGKLVECTPINADTYWRYFPHIQRKHIPNKIRVNFVDDSSTAQLEIWLNDEWVYAVPFTQFADTIHWGYWEPLGTKVYWDFNASEVWINEPSN